MIVGSTFFLGREQGKQAQAQEYADVVAGAVEILIKGATKK